MESEGVKNTEAFFSYMFSLLFGAGGSFCSAFGLICMKIGNIKVENSPNKLAFLCQIEWWFGLIILFCSIGFNGVSLYFGNIILMSSTSCFSIVFTAILSPMILGENFSWKVDGVSISLICIGSLFTTTQQPNYIITINEENIHDVFIENLT